MEWSIHQKSDDGTLAYDSPLAQWGRDAIALCDEIGKTAEIAEKMGGLIRDAGFVDIYERKYKWPIGTWSSDPNSKKIGHWNLRQNWEQGLEGWAMALYTRIWGVSEISVCVMSYAILTGVSGRQNKFVSDVDRFVHRYEAANSIRTMRCKLALYS